MRRDAGLGIPAPPRERDRGESRDRGERCGVHILYKCRGDRNSPGRIGNTPQSMAAKTTCVSCGVGTYSIGGERQQKQCGPAGASATHQHRVYSSENNMIGTHIRGTQTSDVDLRTHEKS